MTLEILRSKTKFCYAFNEHQAFLEWIAQTPNIKGVAFAGRSNVGKSTLINGLFGNQVARTSKTPGRTRAINVFSFSLIDNETNEEIDHEDFFFFDLPGYGFAQVSKTMSEEWNMLMHSFFTQIPETVHILNLQDARHPNQKSDQDFQGYIKRMSGPVSLIFNKIDKLKTQKERATLLKTKDAVCKEYPWIKNHYLVSAEKKRGLSDLEQAIVSHLHSLIS